MAAKLLSAWGYQGDNMALPVKDVDATARYYVEHLGFAEVSREIEPHRKVVLERDGIKMGLAENGGDPEQDGCAFQTDDVASLRDEFAARGLAGIGELKQESRDDGSRFRVFFVVAPDGLCFWFGQKLEGSSDEI